jgi:hypothetical protein
VLARASLAGGRGAKRCRPHRERRRVRSTATRKEPALNTNDTPNPNDERADRALHAVRESTAGEHRRTGEHRLEADLTELLGNIGHLCDRHGIDLARCEQTAAARHAEQHSSDPPVLRAEPTTLAGEEEPLSVVTVSLHGVALYSSSVDALCGELVEDPDLVVPLWSALIDALGSGSGSEDPDDIPRRHFFATDAHRPALARQLAALRIELVTAGADSDEFPAPDGGWPAG